MVFFQFCIFAHCIADVLQTSDVTPLARYGTGAWREGGYNQRGVPIALVYTWAWAPCARSLDRTLHSGQISQEDDDDGHVVGGPMVEGLADQPLGDHVGRFGGVAAAVDDARVVEHLEGQTPARPGLRAAPWSGSMAASHSPCGRCAALQPRGRACASGKGAPSREWPQPMG